MTYLESITRARYRLARDLTEIDTIVRVVQSRPDWLPAAEEDLVAIQRSLEYTLAKIRRAVLVKEGWPTDDETKFREALAAADAAMGE
jgi:hypothetical protein